VDNGDADVAQRAQQDIDHLARDWATRLGVERIPRREFATGLAAHGAFQDLVVASGLDDEANRENAGWLLSSLINEAKRAGVLALRGESRHLERVQVEIGKRRYNVLRLLQNK